MYTDALSLMHGNLCCNWDRFVTLSWESLAVRMFFGENVIVPADTVAVVDRSLSSYAFE